MASEDVDALHEELAANHPDPLIRRLHQVIRGAVRLLAVLMVLVILLGIVDVLDLAYTGPMYILAIAAVVLALGVTYWLLSRKT